MKERPGVFGRLGWPVGLCSLGLLAACGDIGAWGPLVRLSGSFNGWAKGERAAALRWEGGAYRGVVELPGDALQFHIYSPYTDELIGGLGIVAGVPGRLPTSAPAQVVAPLRIDTPLPARYEIVLEPALRRLQIDLAPDAERGQPPGAAALVAALRGADRVSPDERARRAEAFGRTLRDQGIETPLRVTEGPWPGLTFVHLGGDGGGASEVIGDFNDWTQGRDPMQAALDGRLMYCGRTARGVRLEYRLLVRGQRLTDPLNPEVVWDGAYLPANLRNVLGGNVGEFNSVAMAPDYTEQGSRLRRLLVRDREVLVYLPAGYDRSDATYPSLYIHDGKDAVVRGRYHQSLDRLIARGAIPPVVAVFIPAQSDPQARLSEYSHFPDPYFSDIVPRGGAYERFVLEEVLPQVERSYRVRRSGAERAMLGVDMAGPFTFHLAWNDREHRFQRIASQSGRFGWGSSDPTRSPYIDLLKQDRSQALRRLSFDWSDGDPFQVQVHETVLKLMLGHNPAYQNKVLFLRQDRPLPLASPTVWDGWRARLETVLVFLLGDLA
ncbi:MAG: alpha/beta hydrolase-fold protein [Myxococcales bacterium]|nr:alpha/beta hydrolase-fold protein [Myxococcota bacterium]MDW8280255.1 alpha/beta hydrolase-fold protein [Myxococcales bacterium]